MSEAAKRSLQASKKALCEMFHLHRSLALGDLDRLDDEIHVYEGLSITQKECYWWAAPSLSVLSHRVSGRRKDGAESADSYEVHGGMSMRGQENFLALHLGLASFLLASAHMTCLQKVSVLV